MRLLKGVNMRIKYIKEIIKNKHANNGNKALRNNYQIGVTAEYKNIIANRKFQLAVRDSIKDIVITQDLQKTIYRKARKKGYTKKDIEKIGCLKLLQLLK